MGKFCILTCLLLLTTKLYAFNSCYYLFQTYNLTNYLQNLSGGKDIKRQKLLSHGGHWIKIDSHSDIVSHIRYRVWEPSVKTKPQHEVVLIGGLGQTAERFDQNPEFMKKLVKAGIKVVFLELPGQGHTSVLYELENGRFNKISPKKLFTLIDIALDQLRQNKVLQSKKIHMMGHSYGGWLLAEYLHQSRRRDIDKVLFLDPGLKSFHNEGVMHYLDPLFSLNPFYKPYRNHTLSHMLKLMLKKDKEHYHQDPLKLDYAVSLYLGIMNYNALKKAKYFPDHYKIRLFIAENSEFGARFKQMIEEYYLNLNVSDKRLDNLPDSPHDIFLYTPAAEHLIEAIKN